MAALKLNIDLLKFPDSSDKKMSIFGMSISGVMSSIKPRSKPSQSHLNIPKEYNPYDYKVFIILKEFLRPNSEILLQEAADRIIGGFPVGHRGMTALNTVCLECAEQIPYAHPSQLKLNIPEALHSFYQQLGEDIKDARMDPSGDDTTPERFVNFNSFSARLLNSGMWVATAEDAFRTMGRALEEGHENESIEIQDAWVMGAAHIMERPDFSRVIALATCAIMATLDFHIKELKYTKVYTGNEDQLHQKTPLSSLLALFKSNPTPQCDLDTPEGYDSVDYRVCLVLRDFLQPDSTMSPIDAAESVIDAFPYKYPDLRQLISVCFEIAEQIPYDHPSHPKLVRLLWLIGQSAHHFEKPRQKNPTAGSSHLRIAEFYSCLAEATIDHQIDPGTGDKKPARFVNRQAFLSHIMEGGFWMPSTRPIIYVMARTFGESHEKETSEIRDAWVMGAAQWVLWSGQSIFKLHLGPVRQLRHRDTSIQDTNQITNTAPITLQSWHKWTSEFRKAAESDGFGEECRDVARRAADLMEALEKAMSK
ncbi:hypothetical protein V494_06758 [Pseudogymnoascus sp. VKM F-4513 (FW-928)]|nr:hypothetical protein V494_06758 [Pseudogymnoascus sp. VKM F-4513 (FW-928)]